MRYFFLLFFGIFIGLWFSWPKIVFPNNWKCFYEIITKSADEKVSVKALLAVSPNYLINRNNKNIVSKFRIVNDACFR